MVFVDLKHNQEYIFQNLGIIIKQRINNNNECGEISFSEKKKNAKSKMLTLYFYWLLKLKFRFFLTNNVLYHYL